MSGNNKYFIIAAIIAAAAIGGLIGFTLGVNQGQTKAKTVFDAQKEAWKTQWFQERGMDPALMTGPLTATGGKVAEVGPDYLSILTPQAAITPFDAATPEKRTVRITKDTEITLVTTTIKAAPEMNPAQFNGVVAPLNPDMILPEPEPTTSQRSETINLADLRGGESVSVTANEDIRYSADFTATKVIVHKTVQAEAETPKE